MSSERRFHPSIPAISFITWWIVSAIVFPDRMLNADGDMLRHITHGSWMLDHGRLITADPFSFTRAGEPFVAFEYGSQLIYALVYRAGGLAGVAVLAGLLIASTYAILARFLLDRGVDALLTYVITVGAAVLGAVHWVARPHLFTLLAVALLWRALEYDAGAAGPRSRMLRRLAGVFAFFVVWANLHGGFIFGLILLGIYCAGSVLEMLLDPARRAEWLARAVWYASAGATGLLATFFTPHGIRLHQHVLALFGQKYLLDHTQEFLSPDFHTIVGKLFLVGLLGIITALAAAPSRPDGRRLLLILVMVVFALTARRNIQLFGVTVLPALAMHLDPWWRGLGDWRGIRAVFHRDARVAVTAPYVALTCLVAVVLLLLHGRLGTLQVIPDRVSARHFPVEVVRRARAAGTDGRLFHDFIWGGYLLHAWPEQKVFIDGGTDFYGEELMYTYINTTERGRGWRDSLARWDISLVLVPPMTSFAAELLREPGWRLRDCDGTAALLARSGQDLGTASPDSTLAACGNPPPDPR